MKKRALISVYYKKGIEKIAKILVDNDWEIISTGGTAKYLKENGIDIISVSDITEYPEILDGRVKTLHPKIFGSILARNDDKHNKELSKLSLKRIELVIVNFYPFEEMLEQREKGLDFMLENIDIGGPSMVRAAAKNFKTTIVIVDKNDYDSVINKLINNEIDLNLRRKLSAKAFSYTSFYDSLIFNYLNEDNGFGDYFTISGRKKNDLRYGENPHQKASFYTYDKDSPFLNFNQIQGKELSFNNILDSSMVYETLNYFKQQDFCIVVKHQNPCGAAISDNQKDSFIKAFEGDSKSAFGGIVGFNKPLKKETAELMRKIFFEVIIAPDFEPQALDLFKKKKNLRIIKMDLNYMEKLDFKTIQGGFVVQNRDNLITDVKDFEIKTGKIEDNKIFRDMDFGWKMVKFVKSNAIILVKNGSLVGVGAGQMSRVDAVELAIKKAGERAEGSILLSDAFFPFSDSIEIAAKNNIRIVVQPGGSIRDEEVIKKAEELGVTLLFTSKRHFKH